jgi:hypothetical protein
MNRRSTSKQEPKIRLAVKKETLRDLDPKPAIRGGGFIMKDSVIVKTSGR